MNINQPYDFVLDKSLGDNKLQPWFNFVNEVRNDNWLDDNFNISNCINEQLKNYNARLLNLEGLVRFNTEQDFLKFLLVWS